MKKIRILLPVYNEEESLRDFFSELNKTLSRNSLYKFEILFVLDKSTDNSEKIVEDLCDLNSNCEALIMSSRFGHQECIYAGLEYSKNYDAVIMMDCDFQHPVSILDELLKKFSEGYEIVNTKRLENKERSFFKRIGTNLFYSLLKKYALPNLEKNSADFRLLSRRTVNTILENFKENQIFIRGIISLIGFKSCSISFKEIPRKFGNTKYSFFKMIKFGISGIVSFTSSPLYLIFFIGLLMTIFSFFVFAYYLIDYITSNDLPPGWTSIATLQLIFGSISLLFIGFVGIYIGKIFDEIKSRPKYLIEKTITKNTNK